MMCLDENNLLACCLHILVTLGVRCWNKAVTPGLMCSDRKVGKVRKITTCFAS